jgi:Na+/pantothenate symporter
MEIVDTVLIDTKGDGGTTIVIVQTLISFTVLECIGILGQPV